MKRNLFDILEELGTYIRESEVRRDYALMALGYCFGIGIHAGVSSSDVAALLGVLPATPATTVIE